MPIKINKSLFVLLVCILVLLGVREQKLNLQVEKNLSSWSEDISPITDSVTSGPLAGLRSDFLILDIFAINYRIKNGDESEKLKYFYPYLKRAQHLDSKFFDVYRLSGPLLAYDAHEATKAIELLQEGIIHRPDTWEFPFFAGFIAHDVLEDDKLAFELMSQVATREGTPIGVISLAARFLASSSSVEDSLLFLKGLLSLVPEDLQEGIKKRITLIESGAPALPAKRE